MENKKSILGGVGATAVAIGSFIWYNGGQDVAKDVTRTAIESASPEIKAQIPTIIQAKLKTQESNGTLTSEQSQDFQAAYMACHDATSQNPKIDLNDAVAVYDANTKCLLIQKNQGATLDKMAENDAELKQTLAEIRAKNTF